MHIHGDLRAVTPGRFRDQLRIPGAQLADQRRDQPYSTTCSREEKPDGRVLLNEFDSQRRVTNQWATVARPPFSPQRHVPLHERFQPDKPHRDHLCITTILDYTNNPTTYFYTTA